jgi:cytoskeletal protein RodZ
MSDLERRLEELFMSDSRSRRVDQVNVTGGARRRAPLAAAGFIGAVALAAVAAIFALNTMRPQEDQAAAVPSASSSATAAAPSATTSPTPTVSASGSATPSTTAATGAVRPDAAHGVITRGGSGGILRTEADAAARTTVSEYRGMAVTKDGKRVAYIRVGQTAQQLIVFETGSPGA